MRPGEFLQDVAPQFNDRQIEASLVAAFIHINQIGHEKLNTALSDAVRDAVPVLSDYIAASEDSFSLKQLENMFEAMVDSREKRENGVVFTPEYIVDYIIENSVNGFATAESLVIDIIMQSLIQFNFSFDILPLAG